MACRVLNPIKSRSYQILVPKEHSAIATKLDLDIDDVRDDSQSDNK